VPRDAHLRGELGRCEQALDVGLDSGVRVGDGGGFERCLGAPGCRGGLLPEGGVGEKAGSALGVVDDRDFEERVGPALAGEKLLAEEGDVGDVIDLPSWLCSPGNLLIPSGRCPLLVGHRPPHLS